MTRYERLEYLLLTVTSRMSHPREVEDLALAGPELLEVDVRRTLESVRHFLQ